MMENRTAFILAIVVILFCWCAYPRPPRVIGPVNPDDPERLRYNATRKVLIIGGGVSGLSAALELAERGFKVTIHESDSVFGGRLHTKNIELLNLTWPIGTGFHAWFNNYFQAHDVIDRLGVKDNFRQWKAVDYIFRDYEPESIYSEGPYPLNLFGLIYRSPNMRLLDTTRSLKSMVDLAYFSYDTIFEKYGNTTLDDWAKEREVPKALYDILMKPILSVTLNRRDIFCAAEMLTYNQIYFLSDAQADHRLITNKNFQDALIGPWVKRLSDLGVSFHTQSQVQSLIFNDANRIVSTNKNPQELYDHVIIAASLDGVQNMLRSTAVKYDGNEKVSWRVYCLLQKVGRLPMAPPYKIMRVWFDRQLKNKPEILETPHHHPINLVVQYHLLEEIIAEWANRTGGSVFEFHLYTWDYGDVTDDQVWDLIRPTVAEIYPEILQFTILAYHVKTNENFPSFEINTHQFRPTATYPSDECDLPNLAFAGDWLHTVFPTALMERAMSTGRQAANHVLLSEGIRQATIVAINSNGPGMI